ncbi:uncharacterized protein LOC127094640 [Lathyrus oleraceus]|uniref:uncharacterized protein LOC127094640 n=1 Tax=Pisum sativum TaxID=3888 RepID=UPI0021D1C307|nr:uncharacterized protein LOC127094640 [Pisum sativum]
MSQHSSSTSSHSSSTSSHSSSSHHGKTLSMEFVDEDVMNVTPLCMIPGDTPGPSSKAGDKQEEESSEKEDEPLVNLVKPSVAEKLRTRQGKSVARMRTGRVKKTASIGPSKAWSKVEVRKRKERDNFDSEEDVKGDVPDISPAKRQAVQKSPGKTDAVHLDNIYFHLEDGATKWKYVIQRRVAIERELGQEAVEVKEVIELIKKAGLMKTVVTLPQCYEGLVKEFIVNIPEDIQEKSSREFCRVFGS